MEEIVQNYKNVWSKWSDFYGRSRRREFWYFFLANFIVVAILSIVGGKLFHSVFLTKLYGLAVFVPAAALSIRRLHDVGKSAWWALLWFIPIVDLVLLFFAIQDSDGENQYGANPKQIGQS